MAAAMTNDFDNPDSLNQRIAVGLGKLGTALRHHAWRGAAPLGLTPTQGQILSYLQMFPGATLLQVSNALGVRPATASEAVGTLAKKDLLRKERSGSDARALSLSLTPEGRGAAERAGEWPDFLARAVDGLERDEQRVFYRAVLGMIRALQERGEVPVARMCLTCRYFRPRVHDDENRPHHCALVDAPFGDRDLRIECPEHETDSVPITR